MLNVPARIAQEVIKRFKETGSYNDRPRRGRTARMPANKRKIKGRIQRNQSSAMWSILEAETCSKPHQSIDALKKSLVKTWNAIPQEVIDRAVDDFPKRLKKCIEAGGGHFENK